MTNRPLLALKGVTARYGDVQVLWGVEFSVAEGEIVTLVGANGAGKTTTLKAISGVVRIASGEIHLDGERIDRLSPHHIAALGIAHVPEGRRLFPMMSVKENLELGAITAEARRLRPSSFDRVYALFPRLKERERQMAGTLSGGEQQMAAIARGLMAHPRLQDSNWFIRSAALDALSALGGSFDLKELLNSTDPYERARIRILASQSGGDAIQIIAIAQSVKRRRVFPLVWTRFRRDG